MANNQANVSAGKGVKGGYIFSAPVGTALPETVVKDASELDPAFRCLGFISEDGYVETIDEDSEDIVDLNGDMMHSANSNRVESAQFTLAEIFADALKRQYGDENVTDEAGVITVLHNSDSHPIFAYVLLLLLKNGRRWTKAIPQGQSSELDDLTIASSELCARALTMKYLTDAAGNTCYDYIESTETSDAGAAVESVALSPDALDLEVGGTAKLAATVLPVNAADKSVSWASDKPAVATVSDGTVRAVAEGTCSVTATAGGKTAACAVTVTATPGN